MQNENEDILDDEYIKKYIKNFDSENIEEDNWIYSPYIDEEGKTAGSFYKEKEDNKVWWLDRFDKRLGVHEFSFDKHKIYNLFRDYPYNLTKEEKELFDKENPYWANFFRNRK